MTRNVDSKCLKYSILSQQPRSRWGYFRTLEVRGPHLIILRINCFQSQRTTAVLPYPRQRSSQFPNLPIKLLRWSLSLDCNFQPSKVILVLRYTCTCFPQTRLRLVNSAQGLGGQMDTNGGNLLPEGSWSGSQSPVFWIQLFRSWQGSSLCLGLISGVLLYNLMAVWFQWKYGLSCKKNKLHNPRIQPGNFCDPGMRPDVPLLKDTLQLFTGLILSSQRQWPGLSAGWMEVYRTIH